MRPQKKIGACFGSYGWGCGAKRDAEALMQAAGIELIESPLEYPFRPNDNELTTARNYGKNFAQKILEK